MESKDPGGGAGAGGGGDRDMCQPSGGGGGGGGQRGRGGGQVHEGKYTDQHNLQLHVSARARCHEMPRAPASSPPPPNPTRLLPSTFHAFHRLAPPPLSRFARSVRRHEFGLRDAIPSPSTSHAVHNERSLHVLTWRRYGHDGGGGGGECAAVETQRQGGGARKRCICLFGRRW
jgi:hypothetical protein